VSDAPIDVVRRHYSTFNDGDMEGLMATVAPAAIFDAADTVAADRFGTERWEGREAIRGLFEGIYDAIRNPYLDVIEIKAAPGDRVVGTVYLSGVSRETGVAYTFAAVHVFTVRDGRIARNEIHHDAGLEPPGA
jgi:ketosteroid isomerase-like protein